MAQLRGKQHWQRVDADVRRTAQAVANLEQVELDAQIAAGREVRKMRTVVVYTAADVAGARYVKDGRRDTWHEVVRVNRNTVTVKTAYSWNDKIPIERIVEVAHVHS